MPKKTKDVTEEAVVEAPVAEAVEVKAPEVKSEGPVEVKGPLLGTLFSGLNHPVVLPYGDEEIRISPRAVIKKLDRNKLKGLPAGITFLPN